MHEIRRVLERNGHVIEMLSEVRIGYIVYEDTFQVVAEPFSETRTR
jgi:tRNA splicing ligase